ncbi:hypothetical protein NECAME_18980, partial [Necator americanus]
TDETHVVRCEYNVGRAIRRDWQVGRIQDGTRLVFVKIMDDRSSANFDAIVQRYATLEGFVVTDVRRGYNNPTNLDYIHEAVDHSGKFVDLITGALTQQFDPVTN